MRDSDWSREILLRSDWLVPRVAPITTQYQQWYKQDHSCYLFLFQIANEFPTLLHLLCPNPNSVLL